MDFDLKQDFNIGFGALKETVMSSLTEIFILALTIYALLNNLNRFSNKTFKFTGLKHKQVVFIYCLLSLILIVILIYCKLFYITGSINRFTIFLPMLFILVPCMAGIILIYLETNDIMKDRRMGKSDEMMDTEESSLIINKDEDTKVTFCKIPSYVTSKNIRIIIQIGLIVLILYNLINTMGMFKKDDKRTVLNSLLTNNLSSRPTKEIFNVTSYFLIIINIIILIQQSTFKSCKLNLPLSWDF